VKKLCPNCYYLGEGKHYFLSGNIYLAIIDFIAVIILIIEGVAYGFKLFGTILGIVLLLYGIKNIIQYYYGGNICPNCNKKNMLHLSNPKAQALIKERNLTIPEEAQQQPGSPKTSQ
jgi:predicted membrane protein